MGDQALTYEQLLHENEVLSRRIASLEQAQKERQKGGECSQQPVENTTDTIFQYRSLIENSPDIIYYMDHQGKIVSLNQIGLELMRRDAGDMVLGRDFADYIYPEDQDKVLTSFYEAVAAKQAFTKGLEFRFLKNDGRTYWVELHSRMTFDEQGAFQEEVGILRDITERKQLEERLIGLNRELGETNHKLQAAYQWMRDNRDLLEQYRHNEDIGFLVNRNGQIEWTSEAALSFLGRSRLAVIGGNLPELLHDDSREEFRRAVDQAWLGVTFPFSARIVLNGGRDLVMDVKMTRLTSLEAKGIWALFQCPVERTRPLRS